MDIGYMLEGQVVFSVLLAAIRGHDLLQIETSWLGATQLILSKLI